MKVYKKIILEHKVLVLDGEERDAMTIMLETKECRYCVPIFPPMRIQSKEDKNIVVGKKMSKWTKKELEDILDDELKNIFKV